MFNASEMLILVEFFKAFLGSIDIGSISRLHSQGNICDNRHNAAMRHSLLAVFQQPANFGKHVPLWTISAITCRCGVRLDPLLQCCDAASVLEILFQYHADIRVAPCLERLVLALLDLEPDLHFLGKVFQLKRAHIIRKWDSTWKIQQISLPAKESFWQADQEQDSTH